MKKKLILIILFPTILFCSEKKDTNQNSPYSSYRKAQSLKTHGQKILLARNSYLAGQAALTALVVATSYRVPPARILAQSAAINYLCYRVTK